MSPVYQNNQRHNPEDAIGILILGLCLVVGLCWYIAVSRFHLRNDQCLELFLYFMIGTIGALLIASHFIGRRQKREENWPHPPLAISSKKDAAFLKAARASGSTLLGYNVHNEPWYWPDEVRAKHGILVGGTGAGKTTTLMNIIRQDLQRRFNGRKMPMIILNGKGDNDFERAVVAAVEGAGRMQDLRLVNPSRPLESCSYNPFYAVDDSYQEHVNFIFRSFGLQKDFFSGHQEAYLSDIVRILFYTGKRFNVYDVMVMALDEQVLNEQIAVARNRIAALDGISAQQRRNFEMSVRMVLRSLEDRERVEKIQGLLNELLAFLEDDLSIITGAYQDLLTLDDVLDKDLILLVSLNVNENERAVQALGRIILQNLRLMVGKRYSQEPGPGASQRADGLRHPRRSRIIRLPRFRQHSPDRPWRAHLDHICLPDAFAARHDWQRFRRRGIVSAKNQDDHERLGRKHSAVVHEGLGTGSDQAPQPRGAQGGPLLDEVCRNGYRQRERDQGNTRP